MAIKSLGYVKGLGEVIGSTGDFLTILGELEGELITPRDEAYARLQTRGTKDIGRRYGTWTSVGCEYAKNQFPILNMHSRLLDKNLAQKAVAANRNNSYFSTDSTNEYEESLIKAEEEKRKDPMDRSVILLPSRNKFTITNKDNWEVLETLLKDQAKSYFELNGPITFYPVNKKVVDKQRGTLLTQFWFRDLDGRSGFFGSNWYLNGYSRGRRVRQNSGEAARKISLVKTNVASYTLDDIRGVLQTRGVSDIERIVEGFKELK